MKYNLKIGELIESAAEFKGIALENNREIDVSDLEIFVPTPSGESLVEYIIKKENLHGLKITTISGKEVKCADKHILQVNGDDVYAELLSVGDFIDTTNGPDKIVSIANIDETTFYDIGIPAPHLYYDGDGVLHHNTIITAALSLFAEAYGRSIIIVPNKSLVTQTEEDYINMGLDVGVYYGNRKEWDKTHTICTWQSLNQLFKDSKNGKASLTFDDFVEDVSCVIVDECFDGDTLILTPNGKVKISNIQAGDTVINFCEVTQQYKEDTVVEIHHNLVNSKSEDMLELVFSDDSFVNVTANHKFLTTDGWIRADKLTNEHEIIDINTYS